MKIVPLTPDLLDEVVPVHLAAFRGYPNALLGAGYVRAFLGWFMRAPDGIALVAVDDDGAVLGFVAGAPVGYGKRMNRELLPVVARQVLRRPWVLLQWRLVRAAWMRARAMLVPAGTAKVEAMEGVVSLVAIGTAPERRRGGVGSALVRAFEDAAARGGATSLRLSVYAANSAARALYERTGWRCVTPGADERVVYYTRPITAS